MELYGPPKGMHMKGEIIIIVLSSRVVCISLVVCETGMSTRLWMVDSAAAGSIFGVGIIAGVAAIAGLSVSDTTMVNSAIAGSTVVLVDTSALENVAIDISHAFVKTQRSRRTMSELRENNQQCVQPLHQQVLQRRACQSPPDVQPPVSQPLAHQPPSVNIQPPVIVQQPAVQPFLVDVQQPVVQHQLLNVQPPMHQHGQPQHEQPQSVERRQLSDVSSEEINIEHVEQDLLKWLHIVMTYGEKTQRNCVGYPSVRSCTERDSVISQSSLEIYVNDIKETDSVISQSSLEIYVNDIKETDSISQTSLELYTIDTTEKDQITSAEFPREETFEQDVNSLSSGHLSVTGNESCKQSGQMTCHEFLREETFEQDENSHSSGHLSVTGNESSKQNDYNTFNHNFFLVKQKSFKKDSVNSQISLEVYENDLMDTAEDSFVAVMAEEINIEHVEQDLWKLLYLNETYGQKTQRNCVGHPSVRSYTERDSVISQTSLELYENDIMETDSVISQTSMEIYENDIMETDQITCAEFPREETFEQDVNSHSSGHLSVTGNESCKQNEEGILFEIQIVRIFGNSATLDLPSSDFSSKMCLTKQKICQHILLESTQQEDGTHLNGCSSGYMSVNASCKDRDQMTCAEFRREETFEQEVNSHSSGHLSVTGIESCKQNEEGILSEFQIERSFGNSATLNLPSSHVSKKIGVTKQKICKHILLESTQQEDGTHLNGCSSGFMSEIASCKDRDQMTCAEFPKDETFEQDVNSHSSGYLSVTGNEGDKDTDQMTCAEFPKEETFEQDVNYHSSGHLSVTGNEGCKQNAGSKRLDWYSQQSDGKDHPDSRVNENGEDLCSRETIKCQLDRVEEWLKSNDFERMNTDNDDYTGCGENEIKRFENSITQCNKECKYEKLPKDKAITDVSCLTRSCSNTKAKGLNKDNDSGHLDYFPNAHPLHDRSKANLHEHFETHAKIKGNFQTNPLYCISITPKTESMLYPQESQRDSNETKIIASSSRKSNSLQNISNNESKHKIKTSLLDTNPAPVTLPDPFHRDVLVVV